METCVRAKILATILNLSMTKTHEIEYPDAPSGYVTFYNYKEPLMKFTEGYGYKGALVFDGKTEDIQCHFCGEWFGSLPHHLAREHNMSAAYYKEKTGLLKTTALINESARAKLIASGLDKRLQNLRQNSKKSYKMSDETKAKIKATMEENRAELQNLRGTCPEQLIDRLQKQYRKLGRTPTEKEMSYHETLVKVYGSFKRACAIANVPYRRPGLNFTKLPKYSKEELVKEMRLFFETNKRLPKWKEIGKAKYNCISKWYDKKEMLKEAVSGDGVYRKPLDKKIRFHYTNSELIKFLKTFESINGRRPSISDCKRGLLPWPSRFSYNFGSWKNALESAFPVLNK